MPLLLVQTRYTLLMAIGFVLIVVGVALSVLAYRRLRRFDTELTDFHGNPASDPTGLRQLGAMVMLVFGLMLLIIIGPILLLLG